MVDWYNNNWGYRKPIYIEGSKISGTHDNFPILLSVMTDFYLSANAHSGGKDFIFTDDDGTTRIHCEIENWLYGSGNIWIRVPTLEDGTNKTLYLYYGEGTDHTQDAGYLPTGTWDIHYLSVYHMYNSGSSELVYDSTTYFDYATKWASGHPNESIDAKVYRSQEYDGVDDGIYLASSALYEPSSISLESWYKMTEWGSTYPRLLSKEAATAALPYALELHRGSTYASGIGMYIGGFEGEHGVYNTNILTKKNDGIWHYAMGTFATGSADTNYLNVYIDGDKGTTTNTPFSISGTLEFNSSGVVIGDNFVKNREFEGIIDEVRISNIARSYGWYLTNYRCISSNRTFLSLGKQSPLREKDLQIYYSSMSGRNFINCWCTRWDVQNYNVILETFVNKTDLQSLRSNITPGATGELYTVLGRPRYYDSTWQGENTIMLSPNPEHQLSNMRNDTLIFVKNITDQPFDGPSGYINVKIEGLVSGSGNL